MAAAATLRRRRRRRGGRSDSPGLRFLSSDSPGTQISEPKAATVRYSGRRWPLRLALSTTTESARVPRCSPGGRAAGGPRSEPRPQIRVTFQDSESRRLRFTELTRSSLAAHAEPTPAGALLRLDDSDLTVRLTRSLARARPGLSVSVTAASGKLRGGCQWPASLT